MDRRVPRRRRSASLALLLLAALGAGAEQVRIRGDLNETVFAEGKEHSVWTGNVVLESEDVTFHADRVDLWGSDFMFAECQGGLRVLYHKKELYLTCDRISYNRKTKFLVALGNVYMEDRKNGIVVKGETLQNDDERDETIVQVRVRIFRSKDDLSCRAEFARYLREEDRLVLSGMPYVLWKGDEYRGARITVDLEAERVRMEEGEGKISSDEGEAEGGTP